MQTFAMLSLMLTIATNEQTLSPTETDLKTAYIACERHALSARMDEADVAACSKVYEELKRRVFSGSFSSLRGWYESVRPLSEAVD